MSQPAVVIIARHGPRLDVADREWHLTTPTPYDPPLTYGGWNQSRSLGLRIASLLHAREQALSSDATTVEPPTPEGVKSHDFAAKPSHSASTGQKRKRRKHRIVIHTSPYLRCVQTSVAIAAGISQFNPLAPNGSLPASRARTPNYLSSMSPRTSLSDHSPGMKLLTIPEPQTVPVQDNTKRMSIERHRHKRVKLRVDAFLGEWLNPEYFEDITPPPPSSMMVATAKAELMQNDTIDVFTPTITHQSSRSSLWGGASNGTRPQSRDSALEDWDDIVDALTLPTPRRDRTSSHSSVASSASAGSMPNPYRLSQGPQSYLKTETVAYAPPTPTYAMSTSDRIPKGYVAHAKNHCTDIDFQWDSGRYPQDWGDGGEYGEEWSLMHRRFRRGFSQMIHWYGKHNADDRGEDALGFEQAEQAEDNTDEQEDLVIILVTHGAGCNALIGALTGQPVLLDVGTASLTMGIRKDDAPSSDELSIAFQQNGERVRRGSLDVSLTTVYDLRIVASTEHLRPGFDPLRHLSPAIPRLDTVSRLRPVRGDSLPDLSTDEVSSRNSRSTALGSIRRPHSSSQVPNVVPAPTSAPAVDTREVLSAPESRASSPAGFTGLWTPPSARTPQIQAKYIKDERRELFSSLNEGVVDRPTPHAPEMGSLRPRDTNKTDGDDTRSKRAVDSVHEQSDMADSIARLREKLSENPPHSLSRGLSQKMLWGAEPSNVLPIRSQLAKRRWTMNNQDQ